LENIGLVLEGGGYRGVYTAGVLDFFMDEKIAFPFVIGVSAGACNAVSYIAGQRGRNKRVNIDFAGDRRYVAYSNLLKTGSVFGMDFLFSEIPKKLLPLDYETYESSSVRFLMGATDVETGQCRFYEKEKIKSDDLPLRASSSLPLLSRIVPYDGRLLLDGGIADPIPIRKAIEEGMQKNVVILTREDGYLKKESRRLFPLYRRAYRNYPAFVSVLERRHETYNETLGYLRKLEQSGEAFVFRPSQKVTVKRIEKNKAALEDLYSLGYADAKEKKSELLAFLSAANLSGI